MHEHAADLARRLAAQAETVCRHYLPNGRRSGGYWLVGDSTNTPGRSLYLRLKESGAGKWTDAATGAHGDLLDIIRDSCRLSSFRDVIAEARRFLRLPHPASQRAHRSRERTIPAEPQEAARRLFAMATPIAGTLAESYLRQRGITDLDGLHSLRFHPRCYYRPDGGSQPETWPALIAGVTDLDGRITGVHRTWLDPSNSGKAPIATPRRALGHLLGNGVRIGAVLDVMAAGEGIETMLSLHMALPGVPMVAALSASHLAALQFPATLRRLYVAVDNDPAGRNAGMTLAERASQAGIETRTLIPRLGDFNDDLRVLGLDRLSDGVATQLASEDTGKLRLPMGVRL